MRSQGIYHSRFSLRRYLNDIGKEWATAVAIQEATEEAFSAYVEVAGAEALRAGAKAYAEALKVRRVSKKDAPVWEPVLYGIGKA